MSSGNDDYRLPRHLNARIRLNQQHFIYPKIFGYLLHPSIPRGENLRIADVGTGTGVWMFDAAGELPKSTQFHGFDVSLHQIPPKGWTPDNTKFAVLDIEKDLPAELEGAFDIVNIRLFVIVVKDNDHIPILGRLHRMLKPGGGLQWTDADMDSGYADFFKADPSLDSSALTELDGIMRPHDKRFRPTWPKHLPEHFRHVGFEHVTHDFKTPQDYIHWVTFLNDVITATYGEVLSMLPAGETKEKAKRVFNKADQESWSGVAWKSPRINVVGRKK